jgi:hypothetical protein
MVAPAVGAGDEGVFQAVAVDDELLSRLELDVG